MSACLICSRTPGSSSLSGLVSSCRFVSLKMIQRPSGKCTGSVTSPTFIVLKSLLTKSGGKLFCLRSSSLAKPMSPPRTLLWSSLYARATVAKSAPVLSCADRPLILAEASASLLASFWKTPPLSRGSATMSESATPRVDELLRVLVVEVNDLLIANRDLAEQLLLELADGE